MYVKAAETMGIWSNSFIYLISGTRDSRAHTGAAADCHLGLSSNFQAASAPPVWARRTSEIVLVTFQTAAHVAPTCGQWNSRGQRLGGKGWQCSSGSRQLAGRRASVSQGRRAKQLRHHHVHVE